MDEEGGGGLDSPWGKGKKSAQAEKGGRESLKGHEGRNGFVSEGGSTTGIIN